MEKPPVGRRVCRERPDGLLEIGGLWNLPTAPATLIDREGVTWTLLRAEPRYLVYKAL